MQIDKTTGKYIFSALLVTSVIVMGINFTMSGKKKEDDVEYNLLKQYLVNDSSLARSDKPIIWIHNEYPVNDRNWSSFGSRNSNELNKPIVYLTVNSIIKQCGKSFRICVIDDNSFTNLIPGWNVDMDAVSDPTRSHYRFLAFLQLLYIYGGVMLPPTFLCFKNIDSLYYDHVKDNNIFATESPPVSIVSGDTRAFACSKILGSEKQNETVKKLLKSLEPILTNNHTDAIEFEGVIDKMLNQLVDDDNIVSGKIFGYFTDDNHPIVLEGLCSDTPIKLHDNNVGINIPVDDIIQRHKHNWISKLDMDELPKMNNNIGYLLSKIYCRE